MSWWARRWVPASAAALCLAALAAAAQAQNALNGRLLFEDTPNASGISGLTGACTSCHGSVENRRTKIAGDAHAEISVTFASDRFRLAIASVGAMAQFDALSPLQVQDIAAYIADTPRRSTDRLDFTTSAVNTPSPPLSVDLRHALATTRNLQVMAVAIAGADAARFSRIADACDQQSLAAGQACRVTVGYSAPDTALASAALIFTLREAGSTGDFTRGVGLNGAVAGAPAPPPAAGDSGGGALGGVWLAALGLGVALLRRQRRGAR